jgi:hypothetical protein
MGEKDYRLVFVGNTQVGLIGLKEIFEELKSQKGKPGSQLKEMLVEKVGQKNYVPRSVREEYAMALFREFKKFLGEKVEEERSGFLDVIILGQGCYSCDRLEQDVMSVLSESEIQANLNHITEPSLFAQYGNPAAPALIINGKVKSKGILPVKSMIKKWLEEEKG